MTTPSSDAANLREVAVVIATRPGREALLLERALPSVFAQTVAPAALLVVQDRPSPETAALHQALAALATQADWTHTTVELLPNRRTVGMSGTGPWNTGAQRALELGLDGGWLAILDDDDAWRPRYLERCLAAAQTRDAALVVSGLLRITPAGTERELAPDPLRAEHALVGNPGVQGSNLFVSLDSFHAVGGFDEDLASATDRDLLVRLLDHLTLTEGVVARVEDWLVEHHAEASDRVTTDRDAKQRGLDAFFRKHGHRLDPEQRSAAVGRARQLFGYEPRPVEPPPVPTLFAAPPAAPYPLLVGVISGEPAQLTGLLDSLMPIRETPCLASLQVLVLQNGAPASALRTPIERARAQGLGCTLIREDQQRRDAVEGLFGVERVRPEGQVGIAQARTMLQRYLGARMLDTSGAVAWVLDDDMRLDGRAAGFLAWLPAFRDAGVDVVLGAWDGSSPNPPLNGLRVALMDLWHNLRWLDALDPTALLPDRSAENRALQRRYPDYYYDLSRKHTGHLEAPCWLEPAVDGETVACARARLVAGALPLLNGAPLTRPVLVEPPVDPVAEAVPSVNRGGSTFVLEPRALCGTPNAVVRVDGREARRSDMVWAIVNRHRRGLTIQRAAFPVLHRGRVDGPPRMDLHKVVGEIVGSAFYGAFTGFLADHPGHRLDFEPAEIEAICTGVQAHIDRRLRALAMSFLRIRGLAPALAAWPELGPLVAVLRRWFAPDRFAAIEAGVRAAGRDDFARFLTQLPRVADAYRDAQREQGFSHFDFEPEPIEGDHHVRA
jgi:hypothetical protein